MKIGEIIASQLGGTRKLNAMTGAYNFMLLENGLSFRLKNPSANYVKIELNGKDLYDVEIGRVRGGSYKIVHEYHDIYNDQLKEVIEMGTGMYLSLEDGGVFGAGHFEDGGAFGAGHFAEGGKIFSDDWYEKHYANKSPDYISGEIAHTELSARKFYKEGDEERAKDREEHAKKLWSIFYKKRKENKTYENGGAFGAGHFAEGGMTFNPQTATFFVKDNDGKVLLKTKSLNKASDYTVIHKNNLSPIYIEAVDANGVVKKVYSNGGAFGAGHFAEGGDINAFTMQMVKGTGNISTEVITEERKISFEDGGAFGAGHFAKGGSVDKKFVPTVKFKVGDLVWDKGNKRYGTVMNIFDDPINGADGELRLDSDGMQIIFTYNKKTYENTGYNLIKLGEEGDEGNFTFDKLEETKNSANRLINSQIKYKDKENEKYYRTVYKRLLDGEFDSKISYKKYIPHANIKTVTIKKGGKELTYKAEDVYNGVYVLENGGGLKGRAFYTKKADVVKVTLNDGSEVMPVNGFWIKKTAEPITGATTSDADSVFKRIIRDAKLVKVGDSKKYDAKDLKKINAEMVKKLLEAGYTEQQIRNKFLGYTHDNEVLADGEFAEYETTIFSYMEDYIPTIIQQLVDAQKSKTFAVTFEYPEFDWTEIIKKYKISTTPKEFVKKREGTWRYDYYYQFFQGENIVIDHNYGYKEFDKEGKLIGDTTKDGKKLVNANKLSAWQKERGEKAGFNNGFWTVSSSKIEVIDDVIKMLTSQKDGYCKEIEFYSDYNSELLKENGAKFENGGAFGAGHFAMGGKVTFDEKSAAIAKNFVGKSVEPKYQSEYGETYSKEEASEVGDKIAGAQRAKYESKPKPIAKKKASGGLVIGNPKMKAANDLAKQIRKDGEKWSDALKRAHIQLKG